MNKEIKIVEMAGVDRTCEYIRVAVPFARGETRPDEPMIVIDAAGQPQPCQTKPLKCWPDGSVKWLLLDCAAKVSAGGTSTYLLTHSADSLLVPSTGVRITPGHGSWLVDTGVGTFTVDVRMFRPFLMVQAGEVEVLRTGSSTSLLCAEGNSVEAPLIEDIRLEDNGPLRAVVRLSGRFVMPTSVDLRFHARLHFFAGSMVVKIEFTIHNPQAAKHPGGLWDLGDPGSFLFKELALVFPLFEGMSDGVSCTPEIGAVPIVDCITKRISIYQESSGGNNWQSPNHRNRDGRVPLGRNGYIVEVDGKVSATGSRATPVARCGTNGIGIAAALPYFWQEFPKSIDADGIQLKISLFPARFPDLHELQGGEQKTHLVYLDFAARSDSLSWALSPLRAFASPYDYRASGIFSDLPGQVDLFDQFSTASEVLKKRETADEFGWRNFGDIYADHEAVYHQGGEPFVTHYNNQYDFVACAYRKFFATGDPKWGEFAADLARHVRDVDLYHTDGDREEYNHGLFWHTDHYIDAGLSNHRSFSREHLLKKDPRCCGGGPGAEHCYTTGLMIHYFQTGDPEFKQAVITLAEWVMRSLTGPQTVLGALKRGADYIGLYRSSHGTRRSFPRYPLTRGTGNAINACLDAYEVDGGRPFLEAAEKLIRGALHPDDDMSARNLLDAEKTWHYTILLIAVVKFLDKKRELVEYDAGAAYARACLLAYAEWMLDNEYPYLDKPEILEYPNETWAAQDLRKSVIFFHAARYTDKPGKAEIFLEKARFFFETSRNELLRHDSSRFVRPVVLMLQNGWVESRLFESGSFFESPIHPDGPVSGPQTPYLTVCSVIARITSEIAQAMMETSLRREAKWLQTRVRS